MHIARDDVPVMMSVPGATARRLTDFGDASGYGQLGGEYFSFGAGTDIAPLLEGLADDLCHSPHWGYVLAGSVVVRYGDGSEETCSEGELFHWPPPHTVRAETDADLILFSPQAEHGAVLEHIGEKLGVNAP